MRPELIGYSDRFSVVPGQSIRFMVSTDQPSYRAAIVRLRHANENPAGPGFKEAVIETPANREYHGRKQVAHSGSYVRVESQPPLQSFSDFTVQAWIYPTTAQQPHAQGLISKWSPASNAGFALRIEPEGDLALWIGSGSRVERARTGAAMRSHQWYFVAATFSAATGDIKLYQVPLSIWPADPTRAVTEQNAGAISLKHDASPVLVAATHISPDGTVNGAYNGKVDSPRLFSRVLNNAEIEALRTEATPASVAGKHVVASWDFSANIMTARITDAGPHALNGVVINMPMRAVTGHNWDATEFDFKRAPQQYGAIHFHTDDLEDAKWQPDFEWTVPDGLRSGIYAARLRAGDLEDYIAFVVRPPQGTATAPILYLLPTMTYLAYGNDSMRGYGEHGSWITSREIQPDPLDEYLKEHPEFAKSIYDIHADGSGYCYSSRLRPIMGLRPKYKFWIVGTSRHLAADLSTIDWMEEKGFAFDVHTDEDLHNDGEALLARYKTVVTGTHPEYWTTPMLTALENYLGNGGRMMYLGGNGFYWVTAVDPDRPHVVEVRRGISGTRAWNSAPGEAYHSATGEMGALWRHRGKAPNQLSGIGFTAQGWNGTAGSYVRQPGSFEPRAAFIFEGVGPDEVIGNFGLVLGGAAGDELDRVDTLLGTPPHTLVLATSTNHDKLILPVIEDANEISGALIGGEHDTVHADMVYFEMPNNGAVFSTGSITWCGSLSHNNYDNNVSRITENVLRRFSSAS